MFVDYEASSDEEEVKTTKPKEVPKEQPKPVQEVKKKVTLPSALNFLNKVPATSFQGAQPEESTKPPVPENESYNNVPPPSFSLKAEAETREKIYNTKRRLPEEYQDKDECDVMDKYVKLNDKDEDEIVPEKKNPTNPIKGTQHHMLVPTQTKTKRANIPTLD
mgnify:CR=1 FL=1